MIKDSLLGQQLDEYRLETLLGQGGMARVYRGLDIRLKRYVAVKVIDTPFRADPDYVLRFEREAQAIAQLEHPNIVRLYRYGETNGLLYMAMQYVDGASLSHVLTSYQEVNEFIAAEDVQHFIREVCLALDYAHSHGVIHRDVKPANIILDQNGRAYLTDFGLALLTEIGTRGEILGTPHYIAPEQAISSAAAVPQSDLYSVGVILYEMFTSQLPFDAEAPLDIARMHMTEPPPPPRELRRDINPQLEAVILKALAKEPEERYPTGAMLADALDQALSVNSIQAFPSLTIPQRVAVQQADYPLPPIPAAVEATPWSRQAEPDLIPTQTVAAGAKSSRFSIMERIAGLSDLPRAWRVRYRIFIGIILISALGYCAAFIALAQAPSTKISLVTETPTARSNATIPQGIEPSPSPVSTQPVLPTFTPSPTPSATETSTSTLTPTFSSTPTDIPTDTLTPTPSPTLLPSMTDEPTDTPTSATEPLVYTLLVAKRGEDSLFVVNETAIAFPLARLRLGDGPGTINGAEWGIDTLKNGECVTAWKDSKNPKPPDKVTCTQVGAPLTRDRQGRFWKSTFNVYFDGEQIDTCRGKDDRCALTIVVR